MNRVIAAIDDSPAAKPVVTTANAVAVLLAARVDPILVVAGNGIPRHAGQLTARATRLSVGATEGSLVSALIEAGRADDVVAVVLGARRPPTGPRPLGRTALAVATSLSKPIVVVAPDARAPTAVRRVLVPVEGAPYSVGVPELIPGLFQHAGLDVVAVYVVPETAPPAFTDQPQHEGRAFANEFLRRHCSADIETLRLQTRIGRPEELIPRVSEEIDPDLIALSWSQRLDPGRAEVVRAVLARCRRPVLLVPVPSNPPGN